jgi:tetratricopeptide (TPR) repeat protein
MTALHYAVRYARPELVELLLDGGAVTYAKTENMDGEPETPFDWLARYDSASSSERNPNIPEEAVPRLADRLQPPTAEQAGAIAKRLVVQAEAEYAEGNVTSSYRTLKNALRGRPDDSRALSDLSLVALRAGMLGESLGASRALIDAKVDPPLLAKAWFNYGLACEQAGWGFQFDGSHHCTFSFFVPFLTAWSIEPSTARARKIEQRFHDAQRFVDLCAVIQPDGSEHRYYFVDNITDETRDRSSRIYVYRRAGNTIDPVSIAWSSYDSGGNPHFVSAAVKVLSTYDFGSFGITVLTTEAQLRGPYTVEGTHCDARH